MDATLRERRASEDCTDGRDIGGGRLNCLAVDDRHRTAALEVGFGTPRLGQQASNPGDLIG